MNKMNKTVQTLRRTRNRLRACFLAALLAAGSVPAFAQSSGGTIIYLSDATPPSSGTYWTYSNHVYTIEDGADVTVTGNDAGDYRRIVIDNNATATLTLDGATINSSTNYDRGAIMLNTNATLTLNLVGINNVTGVNSWPAIAVRANENSKLTIQGTGELTARGGSNAAGIGGSWGFSPSVIIIESGTVNAYGGNSGGDNYSGGGAGIGGGTSGSGGNITINGGTVYASSGGSWYGWGGAGIGGGYNGSGGSITINGGMVTAYASTGKSGELGSGAGIGGGTSGNGGSITITGGTVTATSRLYGAGIGGGDGYDGGGNGGNITITGGTVTATGGGDSYGQGADIGGGDTKNNTGTVIITGGSVKRSGNRGPQPINGNGSNVYLNTLTIGSAGNDISVTAGSIGGKSCSETPDASAGVYGIKDVKTRDNSKVYFYLPTSGYEWVKLTAGGAGYGRSYYRSGNPTQTLILLPHDITLSQTGNHSYGSTGYGYSAPAALTVTVTNSGSNPTGELTVALSGADVSAFTLSGAPVSDIAVGSTGSFTVTPKTGLAAGPYMETVTVSGGNITDVSFNVSFTVDKKNITIADAAIDPKTYDGTTGVTVTNVTFSGLEYSESLDIDDNDYTVTAAAFTDPNAGSGDRTVEMTVTLSTDPSSPARNYILTTSMPWSLTSQSISKATLTAAHLDYTPPGNVPYDGSQHGIAAPTLKSPYTDAGTLKVYYTSADGTSYPKSENAPVNAGDYKVTADVTGSGNFNDITGLELGDFAIGKIALTAVHLDYTPPVNVPYDGSQHGIAAPTLNPAYAGMGTLTIYYTSADGTSYPKSATAPVNAGAYNVTADITEGSIFGAATGLSLGSFTIKKVAPTLAALDFTLSDIACSGVPYPVPITPGTDIVGLGAITVYYNGSTTVPVDPGEYAVTIDIAEGTNYAAVTGLSLGVFTIQEPPTPIPTRYSVLLPSAAGLTTDPPAGKYSVNGGANFTFTLTPDVPFADGALPQVQTNRPTPNLPNASGIRITPNADGSYAVVILGIRQDIEITLSVTDGKSDPTGSESIAADLKVYTAPGGLVVANGRPDAATVYVYNLAGTLVRLTTVAPGTTRLSIPAGVYIVTDGGAFRCKTAVTR
jgi:hypothetical protein